MDRVKFDRSTTPPIVYYRTNNYPEPMALYPIGFENEQPHDQIMEMPFAQDDFFFDPENEQEINLYTAAELIEALPYVASFPEGQACSYCGGQLLVEEAVTLLPNCNHYGHRRCAIYLIASGGRCITC